MDTEQRPGFVLGFDPGVNGSFAVISADGLAAEVHDFKGAPELCAELGALGKRLPPSTPCEVAMIEKVGAMPKQGVASTFKFGRSYGEIIGVVAAHKLRMDFVPPGVWKRTFGLSKDKDASRLKAMELFPQLRDRLTRKKDHNRAEALLIAEYARRAGAA